MPKEFSRVDRVGDQIQRELAQLVQQDIKDPRLGMVTINAVRVSRDLGYADIYISRLTTEDVTEESESIQDALAALRGASGFLRNQLGRAMKLRIVPVLRFHFDKVGSESRHIDSLIDRAVGKKPIAGASGEEED